ncbi:hypothetical protein [Mesorhizobium sp.]|uniref:hypothetical protein n=1 Tax=Mesorhizobium sp. TaxID=1871066 RepID=UPI000FE5F002|nr:hypothetical protein [Mesorhizobium sp.]RWQ67125.1 MAG: hypothetical protein EOS86_07000 [Mesorhizobium sp.]
METGPIAEKPNEFADIEGAQALIDWFGFVPNFHDAELLDIELLLNRSGRLRLHAFRMTDEVDDKGYFILDRHVLVTLTLEEVREISLDYFDLIGIVGRLLVTKTGKRYRIEWQSSYGVEGIIVAKNLRINFEQWRPDFAIATAK